VEDNKYILEADPEIIQKSINEAQQKISQKERQR
jgi:hypothetical protein